jgi:hypothetical protein
MSNYLRTLIRSDVVNRSFILSIILPFTSSNPIYMRPKLRHLIVEQTFPGDLRKSIKRTRRVVAVKALSNYLVIDLSKR